MIGDKYTINIKNIDCSCRKWHISGVPCAHAIATMKFLNMDPQDFIPHWFRHSTYEETYQFIIFPIDGKLLWKKKSFHDVQPPFKRRFFWRPKKKRRLKE